MSSYFLNFRYIPSIIFPQCTKPGRVPTPGKAPVIGAGYDPSGFRCLALNRHWQLNPKPNLSPNPNSQNYF